MAAIPDDPETTAYQAVRAHELMLDEAVSRFDHARLAPLIVLNGGAVVALLTLLGALLGKDSGSHPKLVLSGLAVGAWVGGLVAAALAVAAATKEQQAISTTHRLLREGLEDVLLGDKQRSQAERVAGLLRGPVPPTSRPSRQPAPQRLKKWVCAGWHGAKRWWGENGAAAPPAKWPKDDKQRRRSGLVCVTSFGRSLGNTGSAQDEVGAWRDDVRDWRGASACGDRAGQCISVRSRTPCGSK